MLIVEDLALLLHDDDSGKGIVDRHTVGLVLAGAVLVDLAEAGHLRTAEDGEDVKEGRLIVETDGATGDDLLDDALAIVRTKEGKKPKAVLEKLRKDLRERVLERLVAAGELRREEHTTLKVLTTVRWPAGDGRREDEIRRGLDAVLLRDAEPDERSAALIGLLVAVDAAAKAVPSDDKRALKKRAKTISEGDWASAAVRGAVQDVQTAVMSAVIASSAAVSISGS